MLNVFKLGYVDFYAKDLSAMKSYYQDIVGFSHILDEENGSAYFSSSTDHHNIILTPSEKSGIRKFGFQYESAHSTEEILAHLQSLDIDAKRLEHPAPGVAEALTFKDPEGYVVELYPHMEQAENRGFQTKGIVPNKVGHLSIRVKDAKKQVEFYKKLGFYNTDWIEDYFGFMTCNADHHVLNFFTSEKEGMHHLALEMRDYSHLIHTLDFLRLNDVHLEWGPSRHGAGHNIACYHKDPEGNLIELFTDGDVFIKELGIFEPRPWHKDSPQKPKVWSTDECLSLWGVDFEKALV
ncbi:VOC family protein [Alkalicoccus daliensis]|uniref:Catechol-2,3-dioxygenase n=1 Tax=Alkalicoccus daliensis TaxID=745820 RepID=A0A1H0F5B3_9BACI|nr:VOC family protein [Alkalicoccus daliensis]SDN89763.1 Catechol-2,3-dioxygenase [Alkalicoccus daliensis]